eukprot:TRINITY_DN26979_c0_g1_i2.p1 TRINITY_DN26979_c0_g1~~TRINITY_DN26979_c0_g1_i2.p1  ORF type:complete len:138 (+),score=14.58 TRINITY_DN26979_c0_g1_i2:64-477(+)
MGNNISLLFDKKAEYDIKVNKENQEHYIEQIKEINNELLLEEQDKELRKDVFKQIVNARENTMWFSFASLASFGSIFTYKKINLAVPKFFYAGLFAFVGLTLYNLNIGYLGGGKRIYGRGRRLLNHKSYSWLSDKTD